MVIINVKAEKGGDGGETNYYPLNVEGEIWGNPLPMQEVEDREKSFEWIDEKFYREEPTNDSSASDVQSRGSTGEIWMATGDCYFIGIGQYKHLEKEKDTEEIIN
jgi:hypothetical protein